MACPARFLPARRIVSMRNSLLNPSPPDPLAWQYGSTGNDDSASHHRCFTVGLTILFDLHGRSLGDAQRADVRRVSL